MLYYSNDSEYGVRLAVALTLEIPVEQVELGYHGAKQGEQGGFFIIRPENAAPDPAAVAEQAPPPPEDPAPVTDVEIAIRQAADNFERARLAAPKALDRLKGTIHTALVSGGMSSDEATAAGVGLVLLHGPLLAAFEAAGGHPVAAAALYQAIASKPSTDALPWLTAPVLAIFQAALVPK